MGKALSLEEVSAEHLLLAIKPQFFPQVASRLAGKAQSYISLMAGITLAQMAQSLQTKRIVQMLIQGQAGLAPLPCVI
ncbi:MAG: hypothetical protein R2865_06435 [Deinococcales bacterium]